MENCKLKGKVTKRILNEGRNWQSSLVERQLIQAPTPQNDQTHSNNSSATTAMCFWPFCRVGAYRVNFGWFGDTSNESKYMQNGNSMGSVGPVIPQ